jgi:hypothetical protein
MVLPFLLIQSVIIYYNLFFVDLCKQFQDTFLLDIRSLDFYLRAKIVERIIPLRFWDSSSNKFH